ncbi:MAG: 3-hydroxyacyl-CoA dehydrogenase NAD-binding domain-containing protein [Gammaproteobacteria bacterium]|nr:3-hydroxyacyl-CoA dehydrogenase NAD-binding domain-containing protein [Gammaproteobacteria bacterium]
MSLNHWRRQDQDDVVVLDLDVAGQSANVLSGEVLAEMDQLLTTLAGEKKKGLILRSAKKKDFILGANVKEFGDIEDAVLAGELARRGQKVFDRLEALPFPTVAIIHGNCLGGGCELVLACKYRVAREDEGTRLGLPEVLLGIHPGFGGTVRLPRLVGDVAALDLMLTGRTVSSRAAKRMGLVDETVPERHLMRAALGLIQKPKKRKFSLIKSLPHWPFIKNIVLQIMQKKVAAKASPDHYPAPYRILDLWQRGANLEQEAKSLGELLVGRTSRNLVRVFLLSESLKHHGRARDHGISRVHVVGAGVMGGDIAAWLAQKGFFVTLQDRQPEAIARAMQRAHKFFKKKLKDPRRIEEALDHLMPDLQGSGLGHADLVIEAIIENEAAKQALFADVEKKVSPNTLLASNTSSIPLEVISKALKDPTRLVGLHFFNPVAKMQLVEIVRGQQSSEQALARARSFTTAISRLPLDVKSSPGFLVNRILMPYLIEAMLMSEEGTAISAIDKAAVDFGMPMGPIFLADTVGLDICLSVAEELSEPLGIKVPEKLREMVKEGKLGKKSGQGFYRYDKQGKQIAAGQSTAVGLAKHTLTERLTLRLLNEAMACLREGVVATEDDVDAGMVYGTGFAPFLGGPMHYAKDIGWENVSHSLFRLTEECGERFRPDEGWTQAPQSKETN